MPSILYLTATSDCEALEGTFPITNLQGGGQWVGDNGFFKYRLTCTDVWELEILWPGSSEPECLNDGEIEECGGVVSSHVPIPPTCDPVLINMSAVVDLENPNQHPCCWRDLMDYQCIDKVTVNVVISE